MAENKLGPFEPTFKSGDVQFTSAGTPSRFELLEFWRWSASDLLDNTTRGVLAEYLVAKALNIAIRQPRESWSSWDLTWIVPNGATIKVEVKSAAYLQSWGQKDHSKIQFVVPKRRGFDSVNNRFDATPKRHTDLYVFALLNHKAKATVDPTNRDQWCFWVLPTSKLDARTRSQHSIGLRALQDLAGEAVHFEHLRGAAIEALFSTSQ